MDAIPLSNRRLEFPKIDGHFISPLPTKRTKATQSDNPPPTPFSLLLTTTKKSSIQKKKRNINDFNNLLLRTTFYFEVDNGKMEILNEFAHVDIHRKPDVNNLSPLNRRCVFRFITIGEHSLTSSGSATSQSSQSCFDIG